MANKRQTIYTVVSLGRGGLEEGLKDALISHCTNKKVLSEMTSIDRDRLAYVFIRKKKNVLFERDFLILKGDTLYKGRQKGGLRNKAMMGQRRDYGSE